MDQWQEDRPSTSRYPGIEHSRLLLGLKWRGLDRDEGGGGEERRY